MTATEYFNPEDIDHLQAYSYLSGHGEFPDGFLPDGVELKSGEQWAVAHKIAIHHINTVLENETEMYRDRSCKEKYDTLFQK